MNIEKELKAYNEKKSKIRFAFVTKVTSALSSNSKRIGAIGESVQVLQSESNDLTEVNKELTNVLENV